MTGSHLWRRVAALWGGHHKTTVYTVREECLVDGVWRVRGQWHRPYQGTARQLARTLAAYRSSRFRVSVWRADQDDTMQPAARETGTGDLPSGYRWLGDMDAIQSRARD